MNALLTAYVVDDDPEIRRSLIRTLDAASIPVRSFSSGVVFLDECSPSDHGCVILDLMMPGLTGMDVYHEMKARGIELPVIFLTAHATVPDAVHSMEIGATAFLEKPWETQKLLRYVQRAMALFVQQSQVAQQRMELQHRMAHLTQRERQVMSMIVEGMTSKEVAQILGTSIRTVETQRRYIMRKMNATTIAQLAWLSAKHGLTNADSSPSSLSAQHVAPT